MKFSHKLTLSITALLAVFISLGGALLVRRSFDTSLDSAIKQSTGQHLLEKYAFEADLLDIASRGETPTNEHLRRYADSITGYFDGDERLFALYSGGETAFSNLPAAISAEDISAALEAGAEGCILRKAQDKTHLLMASRIDTPGLSLWLLSAFDLTVVFTQRQEQLQYLLRLEAALLVVAIVVVMLLSYLLTRPIKKLSRAAESIASGAYNQRTGIKGKDEIAALARDFDAMAEAVEEKIDELNANIQSRDDFVSAFTHEVKTPMTSLIGYANILSRTEEEPEVRQMAAAHIYHEAKRLEDLSQKLLELMGLMDGAVYMRPVKAADIFTDVARSVKPLYPQVKLLCTGDFEERVLADRVLAADLLRNLVTNAARANPENGTVRVHFRRGRKFCAVLVCDDGRGIPAKELARIQEPFYMVDKSRARGQGGSGVGLSLAGRIAVLHGSALRFKSTVGRGTVVRFCLPLAVKAKDSEGEAAKEGDVANEK